MCHCLIVSLWGIGDGSCWQARFTYPGASTVALDSKTKDKDLFVVAWLTTNV